MGVTHCSEIFEFGVWGPSSGTWGLEFEDLGLPS